MVITLRVDWLVEERVLPLGGRSLHPMTLGGRSLHPMTLGGRSLHPRDAGWAGPDGFVRRSGDTDVIQHSDP
ncbi:hypothetical protein BS297_06650 [Rhodococcus erythropolis]|uniref:Uncharacterized protein n=1 Tax=Rhodococcus erythropolis TaxID=1833 RepID=A0A5N5EAA4_RHOER|nr:hypothetical protein BS297_06650 [Rhodococcus erythropolis]